MGKQALNMDTPIIPGEIRWLLRWHDAIRVTMISPLPDHCHAWSAKDEFGNVHHGHEIHFYTDPSKVWTQALENSQDSVNYAKSMVDKYTHPEMIRMIGFCWCDFCGFVRSIPADDERVFRDAVECPDCAQMGDMCFLGFGAELPPHIIPDEPMEEWKQ